MTTAEAPTCECRRPERGDKPCEYPVKFELVYRTAGGSINLRVPGCFPHALAEQDRALAAGTMARVEIEEIR